MPVFYKVHSPRPICQGKSSPFSSISLMSQKKRFPSRPFQILSRPRRNRRTASLRALARETVLGPANLVLPLFVMEGRGRRQAIRSMPGVFRLSRDQVVAEAKRAYKSGIPAVALFPVIDDKRKDKTATESRKRDGLLQKTVRDLKSAV